MPSPEAVLASLRRRRPSPIPGEVVSLEMVSGDPAASPCVLNGKESTMREVALLVSSYRVVIIFHDERFPTMVIPCMAIEEVRDPKKLNRMAEEVTLVTKLPWDVRLGFHTRRDSQGLYNLLMAMKRLLTQQDTTAPLERLFAFEHTHKYWEAHEGERLRDGWSIFDVEAELDRQTAAHKAPKNGKDKWEGCGIGVCLRPWFRIAEIERNSEEALFSPTYPARFVVPASATDKLIRAVSVYRSRARVPIVSWVSVASGAILARASQPLPGLSANNRSHADEVVCETLLAQAYVPGGTPIPACFHDETESPKSSVRPPPNLAAPPSLSGFSAPPPLAGLASRKGDLSTPTVAEIQAMKQQQEKHKRPYTVIFDARSQIAATANRARGGGFETSKHYNCKIVFLHMENIHAVKDSWRRCKKVIERYNNSLSSMRDAVPGPQGPNVGFYADWEKTNWMLHVQRLLYGSIRIIDELRSGASCLVHCSDGWDRTSQLTSTAMLLIDPHYRTIEGFCMLIEKEWCVPGHKFAERSGHQVEGKCGASKFKEGLGNELDDATFEQSGIAKHTKTGSGLEPSPVFLQWMDAVFQLIRQFPTSFEFTSPLLEFIVENVYSCRFGTFICNFDKERIMEGVKERTISIWTEVLRIAAVEKKTKQPHFTNPYFTPGGGVLRPSCNGKRLVVWECFYLKHDVEYSLLNYDHDAVGLSRVLRKKIEKEVSESVKKDDGLVSSSDEEEEQNASVVLIRQQLMRDAEADAKGSGDTAKLHKELEAAHCELAKVRAALSDAQRREQEAVKREMEVQRKLAQVMSKKHGAGSEQTNSQPPPSAALSSSPPPPDMVAPAVPAVGSGGTKPAAPPSSSPAAALGNTPPPPSSSTTPQEQVCEWGEI